MNKTAAPRISIVVPNYRTLEFTRLCLRSLRKHSRLPGEVIVVDNNSADASLDYLRGLSWIRLIENRTGAVGSLAHREALDLGAAAAAGDWVVFFHSDTIVLKDGWDRELVGKADACGVVGFSSTARNIDSFDGRLRGWLHDMKERMAVRGRAEGKVKLMSYCFGIRREILRAIDFRFSDASDAVTDFYDLHIRNIHPFLMLTRADLAPLLWHTSNVTSIVNEQMNDAKTLARFRRRSRQLHAADAVRAVLADDTLDA